MLEYIAGVRVQYDGVVSTHYPLQISIKAQAKVPNIVQLCTHTSLTTMFDTRVAELIETKEEGVKNKEVEKQAQITLQADMDGRFQQDIVRRKLAQFGESRDTDTMWALIGREIEEAFVQFAKVSRQDKTRYSAAVGRGVPKVQQFRARKPTVAKTEYSKEEI